MPNRFHLTLLLLAALSAPMSSLVSADDDKVVPREPIGKEWEEISNDDGVLVHSKEVPGSDVIAFRGEGIINAPLAKVAEIMIDTPRKLEWVAKIAGAKDVRPIGPLERIEYNHTSSGFFLVRDRDFVFHAKGEVDCKNQKLTFRLKSVEEPAAPETDKVRGSLNASEYRFTALDGGKKTHMIVEIHADPKGSVPKWLVNLFQKSWPRNTIEGIRKQAAKPDVKENATVAAALHCKS
jgi:hypothetical protein